MAQSNEDPAQSTSQCKPTYDTTDPIQQSVSAILKSLKQDLTLTGVISLGRDGVLRSLTADRTVVDAAGFTPDQITAFLSRMPAAYNNAEEFKGADGTKVPQEQWWKPDPGLLPAPLPEEERERLRTVLESEPEKWRGKIEELKEVWRAKGDL